MNLIPTLKVLIASGMTHDEAHEMIGRGEQTLNRYLRFRFPSWERLIVAYEQAERGDVEPLSN